MPQARWYTARHRARHCKEGGACGGAGGPETGNLPRRAEGREPYRSGTSADPEGDTRLEPRAALGGRTDVVQATIHLRRRVDFGGGGSSVLGRWNRGR